MVYEQYAKQNKKQKKQQLNFKFIQAFQILPYLQPILAQPPSLLAKSLAGMLGCHFKL